MIQEEQNTENILPTPQCSFKYNGDPEILPRESPKKFSKFQKFIFKKKLNLYKAPPLPDDGRKCLVLDMDETLIHSSLFPPHPSVRYFMIDNFYVYSRPGLEDFLKFATENFEVFIYTYAERCYAEPILDIIAPNVDEDHRLYRDSCVLKKDFIIKDLEMLKRKLSALIFVDDDDTQWRLNKDNTLVIPTWKGVPTDHALSDWLIPILRRCLSVKDVRSIIKTVENRVRRYTV